MALLTEKEARQMQGRWQDVFASSIEWLDTAIVNRLSSIPKTENLPHTVNIRTNRSALKVNSLGLVRVIRIKKKGGGF